MGRNILIALFLMVFASPLYAKTPSTNESFDEAIKAYDILDSIPEVLRAQLLRATTREQYVSSVMNFIRRNSPDKINLTAEGLDEKEQAALLEAKKRQITSTLNYDDNLDGQVTIEEAKASIIKKQPYLADKGNDRRLNNMLQTLKKIDANNDSIITRDEMKVLSKQAKEQATTRAVGQYKQYLALDPDKDGILTGNELDAIARETFNILDTNKDGFITNEEKAPYTKAQRTFGRHMPNKALCSLPKAEENIKLMSIGVYEGQALSTVTAVGQDRETTAIKINIKDDQPPTYLVLSSYDPIMWQFEGNTDAIKRVVVGSTMVNENKKSGSGVIGIAKDAVTFAGHNCLPYYYDTKSAKIHLAKGVIKRLIGRFPDTISGIYGTSSITMTDGIAVFNSGRNDRNKKTIHIDTGGGDDLIIGMGREENGDPVEQWRKKQMGNNYKPPAPAPEGYDKRLWSKLLRYHPAGIAKIDASKVVSDEKAEPYEILPQMAGIIKLEHEGFIEVIDNRQFRIIKDIPRFPAGLAGGHSVTFLIAKGVKKPEGSAGHSCVIMEETGEPVSNGRLCR